MASKQFHCCSDHAAWPTVIVANGHLITSSGVLLLSYRILCSLSRPTYRSGLAPASMTSTTVDAAVDQSTRSTSSNESIDEQELKHAPGSCHVAQASSLSSDCKM